MKSREKPISRQALIVGGMLGVLKRGLGIFIGLMLIIWGALPLLSEETGLRFGMGYQVFFTGILLAAALFFWFLGKDRIPNPTGTAGVLGSLAGVFFLTIGVLVAFGVVYPQFDLPRPPEATAEGAVERGKDLVFLEQALGGGGCLLCHKISGTGGTRGPNLTQVASLAGGRVLGLTAEQYLLEKVSAGMTYDFLVPEYTPMMPPFERMFTEEQLQDVVTYLLTLE